MNDNPRYTRPMPPDSLRGAALGFARAEDVEQLIRVDFVGRGRFFFDPEHGHLTSARIGVLWAASKHVDKGSEKAGTCQLVKPWDHQPSKWGEAMQIALLRQFYAEREWPHFRITLSAPTCKAYGDREFFALTDLMSFATAIPPRTTLAARASTKIQDSQSGASGPMSRNSSAARWSVGEHPQRVLWESCSPP